MKLLNATAVNIFLGFSLVVTAAPASALDLKELDDFTRFVAWKACHNYGKIPAKNLIRESTSQAFNDASNYERKVIQKKIEARQNDETEVTELGLDVARHMLRMCKKEANLWMQEVKQNNFFDD